MRIISFLAILIVLSITSCEKDCIKATLHFGLIGFSDSEADTIILRRFIKNDLKDTFLFTHTGFDRSNDTLDMTGIPVNSYMESNYNYEIFFPESGNLFTISAIQEDKQTMTKGIFSCTKEACMNTITGYTINGQFSSSITNLDLIYLKK